MADLSTLDPTAPLDTDPASQGALQIRTERADILGWAAVEHALTGPHKIPNGNTASRPAAGNAGRLFINTDLNALQYDTGSAWVTLGGGITKAYAFNVNSLALTGSYQDLLTTTISNVLNQWLQVTCSCEIIFDSSATFGVDVQLRVLVDGVQIAPGEQEGLEHSAASGTIDISSVIVGVHATPTAASHTIQFQAKDVRAKAQASRRQLVAMAF